MQPDAVAATVANLYLVDADQEGLVAVGRYGGIRKVVDIRVNQAELVPSVSVVEGH
jgi:hypothetical protein